MNDINQEIPGRSGPTRVLPRALHAVSLGFAALVTGARSIPMGDNGALLRDLATRAARTGAQRVTSR